MLYVNVYDFLSMLLGDQRLSLLDSNEEVISQLKDEDYEIILQKVKALGNAYLMPPDTRSKVFSLHDAIIANFDQIPPPATEAASNEDTYKWPRKITEQLLVSHFASNDSSKRELWRETIKKLPSGAAGTIMVQAFPLFQKEHEDGNLKTLQGIASLPHSEMLKIVLTVTRYLVPDKNGYEGTFKAIGKLEDRIDEVLERVVPFLKSQPKNATDGSRDFVTMNIIKNVQTSLTKNSV